MNNIGVALMVGSRGETSNFFWSIRYLNTSRAESPFVIYGIIRLGGSVSMIRNRSNENV